MKGLLIHRYHQWLYQITPGDVGCTQRPRAVSSCIPSSVGGSFTDLKDVLTGSFLHILRNVPREAMSSLSQRQGTHSDEESSFGAIGDFTLLVLF